jgi:S-disulfanyl-L-cysteine oxidoreductase SoxD
MIMLSLACSPPEKKTAIVNQSSKLPDHFGFGRMAQAEEIKRLDIDVKPDGTGLPAGSGTVETGRKIYQAQCAACHGQVRNAPGSKLPAPLLFFNPDSPRIKTIGNYWPHATTVFDYVRRAMPLNAPGSLSDSSVYALTAFLLFENGRIDERLVINRETLPGVKMPIAEKFIADDRKGGPEVK